MWKAANVTINACCFIALVMGSNVSCKTKAKPDAPSVTVPAPKSTAPLPIAPKAGPNPAVAPPSTVIMHHPDAGASVDGGKITETELKPAPFHLQPPRPECEMPPRIFDGDTPGALDLLAAGNSWAFIRPQDLPVKDDKGPQEHVVLPSYFEGLPPGQALVVIFMGNDPKHRPQADFPNDPEYRSVKPVWVGPVSDHCLAVPPNDRSILFSVLLADDLALQAVVHFSKKRQRVNENEVGGHYEFNPVLGFELRTVDLKTGTVRDRKLHAADPTAVRHYPIEDVTPKVKRLGAAGVLVYPIGFIPRMLFLVRRTGEIPTMHELKADTFGFDLSSKPKPQGGWRFRYHEGAKAHANENDVFELSLDITPELTIAE